MDYLNSLSVDGCFTKPYQATRSWHWISSCSSYQILCTWYNYTLVLVVRLVHGIQSALFHRPSWYHPVHAPIPNKLVYLYIHSFRSMIHVSHLYITPSVYSCYSQNEANSHLLLEWFMHVRGSSSCSSWGMTFLSLDREHMYFLVTILLFLGLSLGCLWWKHGRSAETFKSGFVSENDQNWHLAGYEVRRCKLYCGQIIFCEPDVRMIRSREFQWSLNV